MCVHALQAMPCKITHVGLLQVVALHKERFVFPISITVSRLSGTGADSMFMALMKVSK